MKRNIFQIFKALIVVAMVTAALLLLLAFLLYKFNLSDGAVMAGIVAVYAISNFIGGFIIGKVKGERKYIWGIIVGITFFVTLSILSFMITGHLYGSGVRAVIALVSCVAGGMLGGMCS